MRTGLISLLLVTMLALSSCQAPNPSDPCQPPCEPTLCKVPTDLKDKDHAAAVKAIVDAGFINHPSCKKKDGSGTCHVSGGVDCAGLVVESVGQSGTIDCSTVIDLTFAAPKP